jgi:hypothetical protein
MLHVDMFALNKSGIAYRDRNRRSDTVVDHQGEPHQQPRLLPSGILCMFCCRRQAAAKLGAWWCSLMSLLCRLELLQKTLTWRHLAPTAPDTLTCYPFADDDPFVMQQCPHVMFAGNQPQFETRVMAGGCIYEGWGPGWTLMHRTPSCRCLCRSQW